MRYIFEKGNYPHETVIDDKNFETDAEAVDHAREIEADYVWNVPPDRNPDSIYRKPKPNCKACAHSFMEMDDMNLTCGAVNEPWGKHIYKDLEHCDGGKLFEQHPLRTPEGDLK